MSTQVCVFNTTSNVIDITPGAATFVGVAAAGTPVVLNDQGIIDPTLMLLGATAKAGENLVQGNLVNLYSVAGQLRAERAYAATGAGNGPSGMAYPLAAAGFVNAVTAVGLPVSVIFGGILHYADTGNEFTLSSVSAEVYLSTTIKGGITPIRPVGVGLLVQSIGYVLTYDNSVSPAIVGVNFITGFQDFARISGIAQPGQGGTGSSLSATGGPSQVLMQTTVGGAITVAQLAASNLSNGVVGTGAVVLASSPALLVSPTAPTQTPLDNSTKLATTAYANLAVGVETSRATAAEALLAPLSSPPLIGNPTAPTPLTSDSSTKLATTAYVKAQSSSFPADWINAASLGLVSQVKSLRREGAFINTFNVGTKVITFDVSVAAIFSVADVGKAMVISTAGTNWADLWTTIDAYLPVTVSPITNVSLTTNVATITAANAFTIGQPVTFAGLATATFLNGQTANTVTVSGTQFTVAFTHANYGPAADTGTATGAECVVVHNAAISDVNDSTYGGNWWSWGEVFWGTNVGSVSVPEFPNSVPQLQAGFAAAQAARTILFVPSGVYAYNTVTDFLNYIYLGGGSGMAGMVGASTAATMFVANNPAAHTPQGFLTTGFLCVMGRVSDFSVWGNSLAHGTTPTAGAEVLLWFSEADVEDIILYTTTFHRGCHLRVTNGRIRNIGDYTYCYIEPDEGTLIAGCSASAITFAQDEPDALESGDGLGVVIGGEFYWWNPAHLDDQGVTAAVRYAPGISTHPLVIIGPVASNAPVGFDVTRGVLSQCHADGITQTSYILRGGATARDCGSSDEVPLAFVTTEGQLPYLATFPYYLGQYIVDPTGHKQTVTVRGVSGAGPTTWNDVGGTTTDNTITWQDGGVFSGPFVYNIKLENVCVNNHGSNAQRYVWWNAAYNVDFTYQYNSPDGAPVAGVYSPHAPIWLTGQTATLTTVPLAVLKANVAKGKFLVDYYLSTTTAGSGGTVTLSFNWNDGHAQSFAVVPTLNLTTTTGFLSGTFPVFATYNGGTTNITCTATVAGATGSPVYSIFASARQGS
jgi:hypothetical protein